MQGSDNVTPGTEDEINLLHYLVVILKRKKLIVGITVGCAVLTAIVSLIMTPIFRAETRILPPQQSSSGISAQILSQLGGASSLIGSSLGIKNPNDIYVGMLKSRTVFDRIIDRFKLSKRLINPTLYLLSLLMVSRSRFIGSSALRSSAVFARGIFSKRCLRY